MKKLYSAEMITSIAKRFLFASIISLRKAHNFNKSNTIAIFAQSRGGSTWFSNILSQISNSAKVDEPLHRGPFVTDGKMPPKGIGKLNELDRLNFYYHQPIPEEAEFDDARVFFDKLFSLKFGSHYLYEETRPLDLLKAKTIIIKFCQGNLMLPWLINHFEFAPIVLLRNPYAVIASQMDFYSFQEIKKQNKYLLPSFQFDDYLHSYHEILSSVSSPEEILAAQWCLNYLPIVNHAKNNKIWLTVSYEKILLDPENELKRIFQYLERDIPENVWKIFDRPAAGSSKTQSQYKNPNRQLMNWKKTLSTKQIEKIENILIQFEIKGYSKEMEPDYSYIFSENQ